MSGQRSGRDAVYVTPADQTLDVLARAVQDGGALLDLVRHLEDVHGWEAFEGIYTVADARQQHAFDHWGNADTSGHAHGPDDALPVGAPPADDLPEFVRVALDQAAADKARLDALHDGPTSADADALDALAAFWRSQAGTPGDGDLEGDGDVNGGDAVNAIGEALRASGRLA